MFKQVSGVLGQGVSYYNAKLAKEAEIHKEALTQIMNETFKSTEEIIQISKKEESVNASTESTLKRLLESKKQWTKNVEDLEKGLRKGENPPIRLQKNQDEDKGEKGEKKVFVRADLNYGNNTKK